MLNLPIIASLASFVSAITGLSPLCTVPENKCDALDVPTYMGDWYEIGATRLIRNTFESGCTCTTANYTLRTSDVSVENVCQKDNALNTVQGKAVQLGPSEFKVTFPGGPIGDFFQNVVYNGPNYVVKNVWVDTNGNYRRALVVSPKNGLIPDFVQKWFQSIWILSRDAVIDQSEIDEILEYVKQAGYDPEAAAWKSTARTNCIRN